MCLVYSMKQTDLRRIKVGGVEVTQGTGQGHRFKRPSRPPEKLWLLLNERRGHLGVSPYRIDIIIFLFQKD